MKRTAQNSALETKLLQLLSRMSLAEKVGQLAGVSHMRNAAIPRLGVDAFKMADGPVGVRHGKATCFPAPIAAAATWDPALIEKLGRVLGAETIAHQRNLLLAPCINVHRHPLGGRNFESYGEDPYLAGKTAAAYIRGLQSTGVGCSVKHFAVNNQEQHRLLTDVEIDERTLREIYLPAFKAAVQEGGAWTVMAAYNQVNGYYCVENEHLLLDILKNEWGFDGVVISDWDATHAAVDPASKGLDLEMPKPKTMGKDLAARVRKGELSEAAIDDKVLRILRTKARMGLLKGVPSTPRRSAKGLNSAKVAREVAEDSIVLLKNKGGLLPLQAKGLQRLAVIGPNAAVARPGGGGSAIVDVHSAVSVLEGLKKACGPGVEIVHAPGCLLPGDLLNIPAENLDGLKLTIFVGKHAKGQGRVLPCTAPFDADWISSPPRPGLSGKPFVARLSGWICPALSGKHRLGFEHTHRAELRMDGKLILKSGDHFWTGIRSAKVTLKAGKRYAFRLDWTFFGEHREIKLRFGWETPQDLLADARRVAAGCDAAVVVTGFSKHFETEGNDRPNLELFKDQARLIREVCKANPRTVVALINGGALSGQGWLENAKAVLECWYPGQEGGDAVARVIMGQVNPSGSLPMTFPKRLSDIPANKHFPGDKKLVRYLEGLAVGYRHFDRSATRPEFPFGHGLSYTTFNYSGLKVTVQKGLPEPTVKVELSVKNTGRQAGKETVQVYVEDLKSSLPRPKKELKAYGKVQLKPGQSRRVSFTLGPDAFSFYHPQLRRWLVEPGAFRIHVGRSTADLRAARDLQM